MEERMSELLSSELEKSINDIEVALYDSSDDEMTMKKTMIWWSNDDFDEIMMILLK